MITEKEKFLELQNKLEAKEISKMEFFSKAEQLVKNAINKKDLFQLLEQAKAKHK